MEAPGNLHLGFMALHRFITTYGRLPNLWLVSSSATAVISDHFCESSNKDSANNTLHFCCYYLLLVVIHNYCILLKAV